MATPGSGQSPPDCVLIDKQYPMRAPIPGIIVSRGKICLSRFSLELHGSLGRLYLSLLSRPHLLTPPSRHSTLIFSYSSQMRSIRKSFGSHKETHISSPLPPLSKPALAIQPPLKVIRALQSHKSLSPHQLSFEKGDFFHVLAEPKDGQWYEASNPSTGTRGLVPVRMFEEFLKGSATYV